jgi:hypothetical protein
MHACVKGDRCTTFFSASIAATIQLRWLLVASTACRSSAFCYAPSETQDGRYFVSWQLGENCAFLADGYVAGGTAATVARRNFPKQFLHFLRDGHGAITRPRIRRDYTVFVHTKVMSFRKIEGDVSDKNVALLLQENEADGPYYHQDGPKQGAISCGQGEDVWMQWMLANSATCLSMASSTIPRLMRRSRVPS